MDKGLGSVMHLKQEQSAGPSDSTALCPHCIDRKLHGMAIGILPSDHARETQ